MTYTPEDYAAARKMTVSGCPMLHGRVKLPRGYRYSKHEPGDGEATMCPFCRFIGTVDDYDVMGLPEGQAQCLECGRLVVPVDVVEVRENLPLFGETA